MKLPNFYKVKKLIPGNRIAELDKDKFYIAIPDKGFKDGEINAKYKEDSMLIKDWHKALIFKRFHDQFHKESFYTLGYFEWSPDNIELEVEFTSDGRAII